MQTEMSLEIADSMLEDIIPTVQDAVFGENIGFQILSGQTKEVTSGTTKFTFNYKSADNVKAFSRFDKLNTNFVDTTESLEFGVRYISAPIALSDTDMTNAKLPTAMISLLQLETEKQALQLADSLGTQFYADGTGSGGKEMLGLESAIKTSGVYGTKDYGTYTVLKSTVDAATNLAGLTLTKLANMISTLTIGVKKPDLALSGQAVWDKVESLVSVNTYITNAVTTYTGSIFGQNAGALAIKAGPTAINYKDVSFVKDAKCPAGYLYILRVADWFLLTQKMSTIDGQYTAVGTTSSVLKGANEDSMTRFVGFNKSKFARNDSQLAVVAQLVFAGNMVCQAPWRQGKFSALV